MVFAVIAVNANKVHAFGIENFAVTTKIAPSTFTALLALCGLEVSDLVELFLSVVRW